MRETINSRRRRQNDSAEDWSVDLLFFCEAFAAVLFRTEAGTKAAEGFCGKLMLKSCGKQVNIETNAMFSPKVEPGNYSDIGVDAKIYGAYVIGDYVMMGENCTIITRNHRHSRTDISMMAQGFEEERPVFIGNDVWLGDRVTILPGVRI